MLIICNLLQIYLILIFVRIVASWFPIAPESPLASAYSFLYSITEPVLAPIRRAIPPIGGALDISPVIVGFGGQILIGALC